MDPHGRRWRTNGLEHDKGSGAMTQYKILVVDDEENIRTLVQTMLKGDGRHVVLAARGKDAITMFQKERPDLTILDIDMPDIDGISVLRQIRTIEIGRASCRERV